MAPLFRSRIGSGARLAWCGDVLEVDDCPHDTLKPIASPRSRMGAQMSEQVSNIWRCCHASDGNHFQATATLSLPYMPIFDPKLRTQCASTRASEVHERLQHTLFTFLSERSRTRAQKRAHSFKLMRCRHAGDVAHFQAFPAQTHPYVPICEPKPITRVHST